MISSLVAFSGWLTPACAEPHSGISNIPGRWIEDLNHGAAEPQPKRKSLWSVARGPQLARFWFAGVAEPSAAAVNLSSVEKNFINSTRTRRRRRDHNPVPR